MIQYIEFLKKHIPHPKKCSIVPPEAVEGVCMCASLRYYYIYIYQTNKSVVLKKVVAHDAVTAL